MLQNPRKTLGFKKNMVYKIPPGGGGKPYPASGLKVEVFQGFPQCNSHVITVPTQHACLCCKKSIELEFFDSLISGLQIFSRMVG